MILILERASVSDFPFQFIAIFLFNNFFISKYCIFQALKTNTNLLFDDDIGCAPSLDKSSIESLRWPKAIFNFLSKYIPNYLVLYVK